MKTIFAKISIGIVLVSVALTCGAAELKWFTDLPKAQAQANAENKKVLLVFHGSDWCPTCAEFQKEVISTPEFITYASKSLVLVDVDFPEKVKQDEKLKQTNLALKEKFNVGGNYPAIVMLNESGETIFQEAGYGGGGPSAVLPNLQRHAKPPAATAKSSGYKDLNVAEFAKMAADKKNVILDVRTMEEFKAGHIAGAVNLDVTAADFETKAAVLDKNKTYLVHCASGIRSVRACDKLDKLDFQKLYNLPGGYKAWVKAGEPVEK